MTIKCTSSTLAVLLAGALSVATAEAEPIDLECASTAVTTAVDTDGEAGNIVVSTGQCLGSPMGNASVQGQREFRMLAPPGVQGPNCDLWNVEMEVVQGSVVVTGADLSQWAGSNTAGFLCFDVFTLEFTLEQEGTVIGGSGRFEDAVGTYQISVHGSAAAPSVHTYSSARIVGSIDR